MAAITSVACTLEANFEFETAGRPSCGVVP